MVMRCSGARCVSLSWVSSMYRYYHVAGLSLAASGRCRSVRFLEINPQCEAPFRSAARRMATDAQLTFRAAAAGSAPDEFLAGTDVVVVDPPRKGLEPALLEALCGPPDVEDPASWSRAQLHMRDDGDAAVAMEQTQQPHTLIYLSCGFPALERDCAALLRIGRWKLLHCEAFLFFPGTDSLETLAVFCRR